MTAPLIGLSAKGIQFSNFILRCIREGYSATQTLKAMRELFGTAYRMQDFYRDFRILSVAEKDWSGLSRIPRTQIISKEWYKEANIFTQKPLQTRLNCIFRSPTGFEKTVHITVTHDRYMTVEELEDYARYYAEKYNEELVKAVPVMALRRAGFE